MKTTKYEPMLSDIGIYIPEMESGIINNMIKFTDNGNEEGILRFNFINGKNLKFDLNKGTYELGGFLFSFTTKPFNFSYYIDLLINNKNFGEIENISMDKKYAILFSENENCIYQEMGNIKKNTMQILN